jgi:esterase FrsA
VLDYLVAEKYTDPERVIAAGTSRGGFSALHVAAAEPRVKAIVAFAPVTNWLVVSEFAGSPADGLSASYSLVNYADKLAGRAIWIEIGNNDARVSTDETIKLARKLVELAPDKTQPVPVELHIVASVGHGLPPGVHVRAAEWLRGQLKAESGKRKAD